MPRTLAEHRERYFKNRKDAEEWEMVVTPAYEDTLEKLISGAAKLQPPHFRDDANQEAEAQILTLQGTRHVTSKIDGDRKLSDVSCSCGVPMVKGSPCLHTAKHALAVGRDVSSLFHYKDTSAAWKEQYSLDVEFPEISYAEAQKNGYADAKARYPPVAPPKVGRPKKNKRIKGHGEKPKASRS